MMLSRGSVLSSSPIKSPRASRVVVRSSFSVSIFVPAERILDRPVSTGGSSFAWASFFFVSFFFFLSFSFFFFSFLFLSSLFFFSFFRLLLLLSSSSSSLSASSLISSFVFLFFFLLSSLLSAFFVLPLSAGCCSLSRLLSNIDNFPFNLATKGLFLLASMSSTCVSPFSLHFLILEGLTIPPPPSPWPPL